MATWDKMQVSRFVVVWPKGEPRSVLRVLEVMEVDKENKVFKGWYNLHNSVRWHPEIPMSKRNLKPEYRTKAGVGGYLNVKAEHLHKYDRCTDTLEVSDAEIVAAGFNIQSGGKVPSNVIKQCDAWLRRAAKEDERALVALSEPSAIEVGKIERIKKTGSSARTGGRDQASHQAWTVPGGEIHTGSGQFTQRGDAAAI